LGDYSAVMIGGANDAVDPEAVRLPRDTAILCLQNEVPEAVNIAAARQARALGARVLLDAAPARGTVSPDLLALTDILAVNRSEATALTSAALMRDTLAALRALGPPIAIMTLSADGLVLAEGEAPPRALPAVDVEALSTHGAGDCFLGTLAAGLAAGRRLDDALGLGQAAAALHVSTPRAARAAITPAEVEALRAAQPAHRRPATA
jgi:ribokinase